MIRYSPSTNNCPHVVDGWFAVRKIQESEPGLGYVSQPAHAQLAGRLASQLEPSIFGEVTPPVIEAIANHDSGWAAADLAALEATKSAEPESFVNCDARVAVEAWTRSIRHAEAVSTLGGIIVNGHFCLLTPQDGDIAHIEFIRNEALRRYRQEVEFGLSSDVLERYMGMIGFCDLLSLCLCSGLEGTFRLPLAHPAHPRSATAPQVTVAIQDQEVSFDQRLFSAPSAVSVSVWLKNAAGFLSNQELRWEVR